MDTLISDNLIFYNEEILPFNFVVYTSKGEIVITPQKNNLKHLLGLGKSNNVAFSKMPADLLYDKINNKKDATSIFEFIDKKRYLDNNLYMDEQHILNKNLFFQDIFKEFIYSPNISLFYKKSGDFFDCDYIHFCYINKAGGYIGIMGDKNSNYHFFNSIIYEFDSPNKYKGTKIVIYKIERIKKDLFCVDNYKVIPSKRFKKNNSTKSPDKKSKKNNVKKMLNKINIYLNENLKVSIGMYGKNTIQVYKDNVLVEDINH